MQLYAPIWRCSSGARTYYALAVPRPEDVLLVVEVAGASLEYDRGEKADLYAHSRIPELWIVDLTSEQIEVLTEPSSKGYRQQRTVRRRETLSPVNLPDLAIRADEVLV